VPDRAPGEHQVGQLLERGTAACDHVELRVVDVEGVIRLYQQAALDAVEVELGDAVVDEAVGRRCGHLQRGQLRSSCQQRSRAFGVGRSRHAFVGVEHELARDGLIDLAIEGHDRAIGGHRIAREGPPVGQQAVVVRGQAHGRALLGDGAGGRGEVGRHAIGGVEVDEVVEGGFRTLHLLGVGKRARPVRGLVVERAALLWVLAVGQVAFLAQDDAQLLGEADAADVIEIRRDLALVGGHRPEGLGREPLAHLG